MIKPKKRGKNYFCEPEYKVPDAIPLDVVLLAILAKYYPYPVTYGRLLYEWMLFVPHRQAYHMLASYARKCSQIRRVKRGEIVMNRSGWLRLAYYDKKVGLPKVLREPIEDTLKEVKKNGLEYIV